MSCRTAPGGVLQSERERVEPPFLDGRTDGLLRGRRERRDPHRERVGERPVVGLAGGHAAAERTGRHDEPLAVAFERVVGVERTDELLGSVL